MSDTPPSRPLKLDPNASSAHRGEPAFAAPPEGSPAYYGFPVLHNVEVEGFVLGEISELERADYGDAFVVAPDGSRAGLIWELADAAYVKGTSHVGAAVTGRWGLFHVGFRRPFGSRDDYRPNLADIVPRLREEWRRSLGADSERPR